MTSDPFPGRCRRCGAGMLEDREYCGRGVDCRSDLDALREWVAAACRRLLSGARWLGLVE